MVLDNHPASFANPGTPTYAECSALGYVASKDKQCTHPVKTLFRNPRLLAAPPKSRSSIFREFREQVLIPWVYRELLAAFESAERSHGGAAEPAERQERETAFPQFGLFATELRLKT